MHRSRRHRSRWLTSIVVSLLVVAGLSLVPTAAATADPALPTLLLSSIPHENKLTYVVGDTITLSTAAWNPTPTAVEYQWYRDLQPISDATAPSYTVTNADAGQFITFSATATRSGYQPSTYTTGQSPSVTSPTPLPAISGYTPPGVEGRGIPQEGVTTTILPPTFSIDGGVSYSDSVSVSFIWEYPSGGLIEPLSETNSYTPTASDVGLPLRILAIGHSDGYQSKVFVVNLPTVVPATLQAVNPQVSGAPVVGSTLTAYGGWNASPTSVDYQWLRNGNVIGGATASTYATVADDVGARISVTMTGHLSFLAPTTTTATYAQPITLAYASIPAPIISGSPTFGSTLTVDPGNWGVRGTTFSYEWVIGNGISYLGPANTMVVGENMIGQSLSVRVVGTGPGYGPSTSADAAPIGPITKSTVSISRVVLRGTAHLNQPMQADLTLGAQTPSDVPVSYVWQRNGTPIPGATSDTYNPQPPDYGQLVSVTAQVSGADFTSSVASSNSLRVGAGYLSPGNPVIAGSPRVGSALTAGDLGYGWTPLPVKVFYTWWEIKDGINVRVLSTSPTFVPGASLLGRQVQLWESASAPHFYPFLGWMLSQVVTIRAGAISESVAPTISGRAVVGQRLTALAGPFTTAGVTLHYQWMSATSGTATPVAIARATAASYTVPSSQLQRFISVRITVTKSAYSALTVSAAHTPSVEAALRPAPIPVGSHSGAAERMPL